MIYVIFNFLFFLVSAKVVWRITEPLVLFENKFQHKVG